MLVPRREHTGEPHPRRLFLFGAILLACGFSSAAHAQSAADFFRQNCVSCHTIGGGRLTGPDLKDVTQRKDRAWLLKFLQDPKAMIDSGDPYAAQLLQDARGVVMPRVPGMTPNLAAELLALIDAESKLAQSQFGGATVSDRPVTAQDIAWGQDLFVGRRALANGGPACVSCHTLGTLGGLGGGQLGPDLTRVYERLGGRKGVGVWLAAPATPTMQAVFKTQPIQPEEILPLLAVMETADAAGAPAPGGPSLGFVAFGFGGMVVALGVFGGVWRDRFRAVRRPLVRGRKRGDR